MIVVIRFKKPEPPTIVRRFAELLALPRVGDRIRLTDDNGTVYKLTVKWVEHIVDLESDSKAILVDASLSIVDLDHLVEVTEPACLKETKKERATIN